MNTYATAWHCTGSLVTTVLTEDCTVTATSTQIISTSTYDIGTTTPLGDITFGLAIIITLISLNLIGQIFNSINKKK